MFKNKGKRGVTIQFFSVDPAKEKFLVPRKDAEHRQVGALNFSP
nr:hypothetical protein [uncultured bacterium]